MKADPYEEGRVAAANGIHYVQCPYVFVNAKVSQAEFDENIRPLLNEWWRGWSSWLKENGLDYNFKPIKATDTLKRAMRKLG